MTWRRSLKPDQPKKNLLTTILWKVNAQYKVESNVICIVFFLQVAILQVHCKLQVWRWKRKNWQLTWRKKSNKDLSPTPSVKRILFKINNILGQRIDVWVCLYVHYLVVSQLLLLLFTNLHCKYSCPLVAAYFVDNRVWFQVTSTYCQIAFIIDQRKSWRMKVVVGSVAAECPWFYDPKRSHCPVCHIFQNEGATVVTKKVNCAIVVAVAVDVVAYAATLVADWVISVASDGLSTTIIGWRKIGSIVQRNDCAINRIRLWVLQAAMLH